MPLLLLLLLLISPAIQAQKVNWKQVETRFQNNKNDFKSIGELESFISGNFSNQEDQAAAVYWWLGKNIRYDVASLRSQQGPDQTEQQITLNCFRQRKGVCEGYAGIMDSLFQLLDIPSFIISGYTRQGAEINELPHAWVAAMINDDWFLFDPTWAAGTLNGRKFEPAFDDSYFMVSPKKMVETHMPFDPIWQFSSQPLTHGDFLNAPAKRNDQASFYNFNDSIAAYLSLDPTEQLMAEYARLSKDFYPHSALRRRMEYLTNNIEISRYNQQVDLLNKATCLYNKAVESYNSYIGLQRKSIGFKTKDSKEKLLQSAQAISEAKAILKALDQPEQDLRRGVRELSNSVEKLWESLEKEGVRFS